MALRIKTKLSLVRMYEITSEYRSPVFSDVSGASCFMNLCVGTLAPPVVEKINGVKEACSICCILSSYLILFKQSWKLYDSGIVRTRFEGAYGLKVFTS